MLQGTPSRTPDYKSEASPGRIGKRIIQTGARGICELIEGLDFKKLFENLNHRKEKLYCFKYFYKFKQTFIWIVRKVPKKRLN